MRFCPLLYICPGFGWNSVHTNIIKWLWVSRKSDLTACLNVLGKRKIPLPIRGVELQFIVYPPLAIPAAVPGPICSSDIISSLFTITVSRIGAPGFRFLQCVQANVRREGLPKTGTPSLSINYSLIITHIDAIVCDTKSIVKKLT